MSARPTPTGPLRFAILAAAGLLAASCGDDGPPRTVFGDVEPAHLGWRVAVVGDVDGDGVRDFAAAEWCGPGCAELEVSGSNVTAPVPGRVTLWSGATRERLYDIASPRPGDEPGAAIVSVDDMDGDGTPELVVATPAVLEDRPGSARVFSGRSGAPLHAFEGSAHEQMGDQLSIGHDFDADGVLDAALFSISSSGDELVILAGDDWRELGRARSPMQSSDVRLASAGDVDGDGVLDLVLSDREEVVVCDGRRLAVIARWSPRLDEDVALASCGARGVGDLNGDGRGDVFVADRTGRGWVYSGTAAQLVGTVTPEGSWDEVSAVTGGADVDGDGVPDFAVVYVRHILEKQQRIVVWNGATRTPLAVLDVELGRDRNGGYACAIDIGDLDGDGLADLLVGRSEDSSQVPHGGSVTVHGARELLDR